MKPRAGRNSEAGLFFAEDETKDIPCCSRLFFVCSDTARTPRGRGRRARGQFNLPGFSSPLPKNIHAMRPSERLPFTPSHPPFLTPPQHWTCSLLRGKQKSVRVVGAPASLPNFCTFCTYAAPQTDPVNGFCWLPLHTPPTPPEEHPNSPVSHRWRLERDAFFGI